MTDYVIDGQNRRIGKKVNGVLVEGLLYRNQQQPAAWLDGTGAVKATFVYGLHANVPEYMVQGATTYRLITDQVGSVRLVVNTATGAVVERLDWDEFGNVISDTSPGLQPFGFAGGQRDLDTGLTRFGARDYDPVTGRWTTKDPLRFGGGITNLYSYVSGDPINVNDPSGLVPCSKYRSFVDWLTPFIQQESDKRHVPLEYLLTEAAYESGWGSAGARAHNNPFGSSRNEVPIQYADLATAFAKWDANFGKRIDGSRSPQDLIKRLNADNKYNSVNKAYDDTWLSVYDSVRNATERCGCANGP